MPNSASGKGTAAQKQGVLFSVLHRSKLCLFNFVLLFLKATTLIWLIFGTTDHGHFVMS